MNTKQKESVKPSRNVRSRTQELRHHQQSFLPQTSLVLSATGSLELRLVSSAILQHTNNNTLHIWLGLGIVNIDKRMNESKRRKTFNIVMFMPTACLPTLFSTSYWNTFQCLKVFIKAAVNKPIQIYWKLYHPKNKTFQIKILIFFIFLLKNIDCGYSLEPPRRGGSNEYPQSMFLAEIRK